MSRFELAIQGCTIHGPFGFSITLKFYYNERFEFSPNLEGVAQKLGLPRPFEVLDAFGRKFIFWALMNFFCTKRVPIKGNC